VNIPGPAGSGSSASRECQADGDTQVVSTDIMDDLADKFRKANAEIDLEAMAADMPDLVPSLHAAVPACVWVAGKFKVKIYLIELGGKRSCTT